MDTGRVFPRSKYKDENVHTVGTKTPSRDGVRVGDSNNNGRNNIDNTGGNYGNNRDIK